MAVCFSLLFYSFFLPSFSFSRSLSCLARLRLPAEDAAAHGASSAPGHFQWFPEIMSLPAPSLFLPPRAPGRLSVALRGGGLAVLPLLFCRLFHFPVLSFCVLRDLLIFVTQVMGISKPPLEGFRFFCFPKSPTEYVLSGSFLFSQSQLFSFYGNNTLTPIWGHQVEVLKVLSSICKLTSFS